MPEVCSVLQNLEAAKEGGRWSELRATVLRRQPAGKHSPWLESINSDTVRGPLGSETFDHVGDGSLRRIVEDLSERLVQALLVVDLRK